MSEQISDNLISRISQLAGLEIKEKDRDSIRSDLNNILAYCAMLDETDPVESMSGDVSRSGLHQLREDIAEKDNAGRKILSPETGNDYFKVPRVIK